MSADSDESPKNDSEKVKKRGTPSLALSPSNDPSAPLRYRPTDPGGAFVHFDDDKKKAFLTSLSEFPSVSIAARAVGVSTVTVYKHRHKDPDFAEAWDIAIDIGYNVLESEAIRRAVMGVKEDVYYKGEVVGEITKYSDTLLMFLLKGRRREVYGDKANENAEDTSVTIRVVGGLPDA